MAGDEGVDLLREVADAVSCGHAEVTGFSVVGLHLWIAGNRSLLRAREAQEGDYYQDKMRNQRTAQNTDIQRFTPPINFKSLIFRDLDMYSLCFMFIFSFLGAKIQIIF